MVMEIILDGECLDQLHRGLAAHLGHPVEEEQILVCLLGVVESCGVQVPVPAALVLICEHGQ